MYQLRDLKATSKKRKHRNRHDFMIFKKEVYLGSEIVYKLFKLCKSKCAFWGVEVE